MLKAIQDRDDFFQNLWDFGCEPINTVRKLMNLSGQYLKNVPYGKIKKNVY